MGSPLATPHNELMTAERVRELFFYDPETGIFINRERRGGAKVGERAGCKRSDGRRYISIRGKWLNEARLAWLYVTGEWPEEVDHINRNADDNRFTNLRDADRSLNNLNRTGWAAREERAAYA